MAKRGIEAKGLVSRANGIAKINNLMEHTDTRRIVMEKMEVMYFIYFSVALLMANGIIQNRITKNIELKIKNK